MSAELSEQQLAEICARAEAATPGPWCTDGAEIYTGTEYLPWSSLWIGETCRADDCHGSRDDAAFIAAARTDVPALLAEIERLRAERDAFADRVDTLTAVARSNRRAYVEAVATVAALEHKRVELERIANAERERVTELEKQLATVSRRDVTGPLRAILRHGDMSDEVRREIADLLADTEGGGR